MKSPPPLPGKSRQHTEVQPATELPQNRKLTTFLLALIGSLSVLTIFTLILIVIFVARNASRTAMNNDATHQNSASASHDTPPPAERDSATTSQEDDDASDSVPGVPLTPPPAEPNTDQPPPAEPSTDQPPPAEPNTDQPPPAEPNTDQPPPNPPPKDRPPSPPTPPTSDPAKSTAPTSYAIPNLESEQLISDWITDPLSIFCTVQLESDWIPEENVFFTKSESEISRDRMARSSRTFPEAWSGIRTCRLDLATYDASAASGALPIATSSLDEMDAEITVDHDSLELYLKLRWRKGPTKVTTTLMPILASQWRDYEKNTKSQRKLISRLVILNATSYGKALRTNILKDFSPSTDDLGTQGSEKSNRLEALRFSLDTFEERTMREALTRINECDYKIRLATTMQRIYYPPIGFLDGYWESLESWQNRIAAAQQPFVAARTECRRVMSSAPNDILRIDDLIEKQCLAISELQSSSEQMIRRSPVRLTLPHTIQWSTSNGATAVLPLVIDCHFK